MFDYKEYWTHRNWKGDWEQTLVNEVLPYIKGKSALDLGCGSGRFVCLFDGMKYLGVDINPTNIAEHERPEEIIKADIVEWDTDEKFDLVLSWTVLQHIVPEKIKWVAEKMKRWGKTLILVECVGAPTDVWAEYCFVHDWDKLFQPYVKKQIQDRLYLMVAKGNDD